MNRILYVLPVFLICLSSCALTPQQVNLNPVATVSSSNIGQGKKIALKTVDERTRSTIGNRGVSGFPSATITSNQDIAQIVDTVVSGGLRKQGFAVTGASKDDPRELRVEVRNLEYTVAPGIITGTLKVETTLKGICSTSVDRKYEHLYRGNSEEQVFVVQFAEQNATHINNSLSKAIDYLLADRELLKCLAE